MTHARPLTVRIRTLQRVHRVHTWSTATIAALAESISQVHAHLPGCQMLHCNRALLAHTAPRRSQVSPYSRRSSLGTRRLVLLEGFPPYFSVSLACISQNSSA